MTAQKVTLILDEGDAQLNQITQGSVTIVPSARLPDPGDDIIVGQAPVTGAFSAGSVPQVQLVGTDQIGPQPNGWTYTITYSGVPGSPASWSFYLRFSDGTTQRLSDLASVPAAQPGQQYLPLPSGTPAAGQLPVATGSGQLSAWGGPDADHVPADQGMLTEVCDTAMCGDGSGALTAGTLYLFRVPVRSAMTLSTVWWRVSAGGTGASSGSFTGLYSPAGTLLTGSPDIGGLLSAGVKSQALTTPQAIAAGTPFVWVAFLVNLASTQPSLIAPRVSAAAAGTTMNMGLAAASFRIATNGTGLTSLPASITPANNGFASAVAAWFGVS